MGDDNKSGESGTSGPPALPQLESYAQSMAGAMTSGPVVSMAMSGPPGLPTLAPAPQMHPGPQLHLQPGPPQASQPGAMTPQPQMTMQQAMGQPSQPGQTMGQVRYFIVALMQNVKLIFCFSLSSRCCSPSSRCQVVNTPPSPSLRHSTSRANWCCSPPSTCSLVSPANLASLARSSSVVWPSPSLASQGP